MRMIPLQACKGLLFPVGDVQMQCSTWTVPCRLVFCCTGGRAHSKYLGKLWQVAVQAA